MSDRDLETVRILRAVARPARLRPLNALRDGEECVCHLTALQSQRQAYVSQQLMLCEAGLIEDRKESYRVYYRIKEPRVLNATVEKVAVDREMERYLTGDPPGLVINEQLVWSGGRELPTKAQITEWICEVSGIPVV